jgi:ketosteroid isomerase-like protein
VVWVGKIFKVFGATKSLLAVRLTRPGKHTIGYKTVVNNKKMKHVLILFFATFALICCNNQNNKSMAALDNKKLVKQYFEHFNNHEWVKMANMYSEISEFKDPSLGQGIVKQTRQQIIDKYSELNKVFPNLHDEVIQIYPSGNRHIIVEFVSSGTATDSSKFELPICTIFTIENGIITKDYTYFDNFDEQ